MSTGVKWENFFASTVNREMACSPELKGLIRAGVPHEHRSKVWKWCVDLHTRKFRDGTEPAYFQTLLQKALEKQNPASKQIELDLLRTLPSNKHYARPTSEGIQQLRSVLLAFSWRNPDIGYCQGLNRWVCGLGCPPLGPTCLPAPPTCFTGKSRCFKDLSGGKRLQSCGIPVLE